MGAKLGRWESQKWEMGTFSMNLLILLYLRSDAMNMIHSDITLQAPT
jgi:hypothetical protein